MPVLPLLATGFASAHRGAETLRVFFLIFGILSLSWGLSSLLRKILYYRHVLETLRRPLPGYRPKVGLILPCRGMDYGFEENIEAVLTQDYPDYRVVFVTSTPDDPAYSALEEILRGRPQSLARLVTSGSARHCSQKIVSLLRGIEEVDNDTEVLAFADSDGRPHHNWLRNLVNPLRDPKVGAATSYRWYLPVHGGFWSQVRSAWNAASTNPLSSKNSAFAWGGATALRKSVFEEVGIADLWEKAVSDDLVLTRAMKKAGYRIEFVPQSLVVSYEGCSFRQLLEWTTRQMIILKVYAPEIWRLALCSYTFSNAAFFLGLVLCLQTVGEGDVPSVGAILLVSNLPLDMVNGYFRFLTYGAVIPFRKQWLRKQGWTYALLAPVASWLMSFNLLRAATTNRISWRGTGYELRSPTETIVLHQEKDSMRGYNPGQG